MQWGGGAHFCSPNEFGKLIHRLQDGMRRLKGLHAFNQPDHHQQTVSARPFPTAKDSVAGAASLSSPRANTLCAGAALR